VFTPLVRVFGGDWCFLPERGALAATIRYGWIRRACVCSLLMLGSMFGIGASDRNAAWGRSRHIRYMVPG